MKTYGIVCEYNPFHNGHKYQIEETKKQTGADHIVAVMSGNYVQRGDVAIIDKFKRAQIAVQNGVDLVVELPVAYTLTNAQTFARASVYMLNALGVVDGISFGSECGDLDLLKNAAVAAAAVSVPEKVKPLLEEGESYPSAVAKLVNSEYGPMVGEVFNSPNNILAVEYLKAITDFYKADTAAKEKAIEEAKSKGEEIDESKFPEVTELEAFTVKRTASHDSDETAEGKFASASAIRRMIEDGEDFSAYVPAETVAAINEYDDKDQLCYFDNLERELLYRMRTVSPQDLGLLADVDEGLVNRMFQVGRVAVSLEDLINGVKTKRYPEARVRRLLLCALLGIRKNELQTPPPFGRILALNERGTEILSEAKGKARMVFGTSLKAIADMDNQLFKHFAAMSSITSDVYGLASREIRPCGVDFTAKVGVMKNI